jgi:hypothetical protein
MSSPCPVIIYPVTTDDTCFAINELRILQRAARDVTGNSLYQDDFRKSWSGLSGRVGGNSVVTLLIYGDFSEKW